jgi:hypothetical protein
VCLNWTVPFRNFSPFHRFFRDFFHVGFSSFSIVRSPFFTNNICFTLSCKYACIILMVLTSIQHFFVILPPSFVHCGHVMLELCFCELWLQTVSADSAVGLATVLRTRRPRNQFSILGKDKGPFNCTQCHTPALATARLEVFPYRLIGQC